MRRDTPRHETPGWAALYAEADIAIAAHRQATGHDHAVTSHARDAWIDFGVTGFLLVPAPGLERCAALVELLTAIEDASRATCQRCGAPGTERPSHWLNTYCEACAQEMTRAAAA